MHASPIRQKPPAKAGGTEQPLEKQVVFDRDQKSLDADSEFKQEASRKRFLTRKQLLALAREAIMHVNDQQALDKLMKQHIIEERCGVFVSVHVDGDLRGCIGNLESVDIQEGIVENAIHAAYHDSRFPPIKKSEWQHMQVHINLLSEPKELLFKDTNDLMKKIVGKGVILQRGYRKATFLPSVWEQLPEPEEFLAHLCMKAGLPPDDWQRPAMKVLVYESEEFSE